MRTMWTVLVILGAVILAFVADWFIRIISGNDD
jgi:hypothetical protein